MSPQQSIAHFRIVSKLGEGGMGAVYRAVDTRLNRSVAIKVLPETFAADPGRLSRFTREAQVLASLNHPHIGAIYGVEASALILELVEGPTLAERIALGPIPPDEALAIARQLAEALDYAHEKGVVHRDLKPDNIKITPEGQVKVLDFGLAKAMGGDTLAADPAVSPTLTLGDTIAGAIMGTAGYMSPEQARGKPVDKRADIWAFGVVLYEMLTGKPLYLAETVSDTLAGVLVREPDLTAIPAGMRRLIGRCLEKDSRRRLRDIADYADLLDTTPPEPAGRQSSPWPWIACALTVLAAAGWIWLRPVPLPEITTFQISAPPGSTIPIGVPAPSPDGRMLAYCIRGADGITRLYVRTLNSLEGHILAGTEQAAHPFWSPDSRSLAFSAGRLLKRIDLAGGPVRSLSETNSPWQGSWNDAGFILFQPPTASVTGSAIIPAEGGTATPVIKLDKANDETGAGFPWFLPDGKRFLTLIAHADGSRDIELLTLGSLTRKRVLAGVFSAPILAPTPNGLTWLLYLRDDALMAQEFDQKAGAVRGNPSMLVGQIGIVATPPLRPSVGVSPRGVLAYQFSAEGGTAVPQLGWYDRAGALLARLPETAAGGYPSLSPDGRSAAVERRATAGIDVWVVDLARGSATRLTTGKGGQLYSNGTWSPDSKRVAYRLLNDGVFLKDASGGGAEETLLKSRDNTIPLSWSPDGRQILCWQHGGLTLLSTDGSQSLTPISLSAGALNTGAEISRDGRYFAFSSPETGRSEVYIGEMPPGKHKWMVSIDGGSRPKWRADGKELFFTSSGNKLMSVDIGIVGKDLTPGVPHLLLQSDTGSAGYDVSADGRRFLVAQANANSADVPITVVLNWWVGLKK